MDANTKPAKIFRENKIDVFRHCSKIRTSNTAPEWKVTLAIAEASSVHSLAIDRMYRIAKLTDCVAESPLLVILQVL